METPSMESEGKGDGHQYGRKPRTPEPIPIAGKLTEWGRDGTLDSYGHWAQGLWWWWWMSSRR